MTPPPHKYIPNTGFAQNIVSNHKSPGSTVIGKNQRTFVDTTWNLKKEIYTPGPG